MNPAYEELARQVDDVESALRGVLSTKPESFSLAIRVELEASIFQARRTISILHAFEEGATPQDSGQGWLAVFGALQALFLLRDALLRLTRILHVPEQFLFRLTEIREARNSSIGHPIERNRDDKHKGKLRSAYYANPAHKGQLSVFSLRRVMYDNEWEYHDEFDIYELTALSRQAASDVLTHALVVLRQI